MTGTRMITMTVECSDSSESVAEQLKSLTYKQLDELARSLVDAAESGMKAIEILEKDTKIKTRSLRTGVTFFVNLIKDVYVAYEERVKEGTE